MSAAYKFGAIGITLEPKFFRQAGFGVVIPLDGKGFQRFEELAFPGSGLIADFLQDGNLIVLREAEEIGSASLLRALVQVSQTVNVERPQFWFAKNSLVDAPRYTDIGRARRFGSRNNQIGEPDDSGVVSLLKELGRPLFISNVVFGSRLVHMVRR